MDRIDLRTEKMKDKRASEIAFRPKYDHGIGWICSLRQNEHDNEFDGLLNLKDPGVRHG